MPELIRDYPISRFYFYSGYSYLPDRDHGCLWLCQAADWSFKDHDGDHWVTSGV
jgi:hypothetical protein